jgi:hypothetical protein
MKNPKKILLVLVAVFIGLATFAATTEPSQKIPEKITVWEYRVIKEDVNSPVRLTDVLNLAAQRRWVVDAFSTHSTGNSEQGVVILKREKLSKATPD